MRACSRIMIMLRVIHSKSHKKTTNTFHNPNNVTTSIHIEQDDVIYNNNRRASTNEGHSGDLCRSRSHWDAQFDGSFEDTWSQPPTTMWISTIPNSGLILRKGKKESTPSWTSSSKMDIRPLWKGYSKASDKEAFKDYISKKEDFYEEGGAITTDKLMMFTLTKFQTLTDKGLWNTPDEAADEKIIC
jgi:hypothetical protein